MRVSGQVTLAAPVANNGTVRVPFRFGSNQEYSRLDYGTALVTRNSNFLGAAAYDVAQAENEDEEPIPFIVLTNTSGVAWPAGDVFSVQIAYDTPISQMAPKDAIAKLATDVADNTAAIADHETRIAALEE